MITSFQCEVSRVFQPCACPWCCNTKTCANSLFASSVLCLVFFVTAVHPLGVDTCALSMAQVRFKKITRLHFISYSLLTAQIPPILIDFIFFLHRREFVLKYLSFVFFKLGPLVQFCLHCLIFLVSFDIVLQVLNIQIHVRTEITHPSFTFF